MIDNATERFAALLERRLGLQGLADPAHRRLVRIGFVIATSAMLLRLFFWVYTHRLWEDALITTLHSENFWSGLGLTHYRPGQPPLHGFTSPLSVLIPLIGDAFHVGFGVEFLKLVSIFAGGLTVLYMLALAIHPSVNLPAPIAVLLMGYAAWEHHQILWGMSGMETQVVTLILLASAYYAAAWEPLALGILLGFSMLARPDFGFWTVIVGLYVLAKSPRTFTKVVAAATAVYAPWIVFTTLYYGSPIPNTIYAKGMGYHTWWQHPGLNFSEVKREVWDRITGTYFHNTIFQPLGPSFAGHGTGFRAVIPDGGLICDVMVLLLCLGALSLLLRKQWNLIPIAAFVFVYGLYYVFFVPYVFGWYVVPFVAMAVVLSARGLQAATAWIPPPKARIRTQALLTALYLGVLVAVLPLTIETERRIQQHVENEGRMQMAFYLRDHLAPDEYVGCEPLGYIGYFSRRPVYDWPGLDSRDVVQFQREHPDQRTLYDMLQHFQPEYIVFRPYERNALPPEKEGWFEQNYTLDATFEVPEEIRNTIFLSACNQDLCFLLYRKKTSPDSPS